jgi:DNA processing protein
MSLFTMRSNKAIEPLKEIVAYEALWQNRKASFKSLSELFSNNPGSKPSDFVDPETINELQPTIKDLVLNHGLGYRIHRQSRFFCKPSE